MVTNFQKKVYKIVSKIPKGKTMSYKDIAIKLKSSPRAVGQALKRNPTPYSKVASVGGNEKMPPLRASRKEREENKGCPRIPCHRVIHSDGTIGGYKGKNNSKLKKKLLRKEKAYYPPTHPTCNCSK